MLIPPPWWCCLLNLCWLMSSVMPAASAGTGRGGGLQGKQDCTGGWLKIAPGSLSHISVLVLINAVIRLQDVPAQCLSSFRRRDKCQGLSGLLGQKDVNGYITFFLASVSVSRHWYIIVTIDWLSWQEVLKWKIAAPPGRLYSFSNQKSAAQRAPFLWTLSVTMKRLLFLWKMLRD